MESAPGRGSTFHFTLSFDDVGAPAVGQTHSGGLEGLRALVADDNASSRDAIVGYLKSLGMAAEAAASADDALRAMRQAAANRNPFEFVIADAEIPSMSGRQLMRQLRSEPALASAAVIVMDPMGEENIAGDRPDAVVIKPLMPSRLRAAIVETLARRTNSFIGPAPGKDCGSPRCVQIPEQFSGLRVLVVEDNPMNQKLARLQLQSLGCFADVASSGVSALEAFDTLAYPVVLMDCEMPGMDGYTVATEIRRRESGTHAMVIIAMTAHAMEAARQRSFDAGMDDYIAKPITLEVLSNVLRRWTRNRPPLGFNHSGPPIEVAEQTVQEIDLRAIEELQGLSAATGHDVVSEVMEMFIKCFPQRIAAIKEAVERRDLEAIIQLAHLMKGESSSVGASGFAAQCGKLQNLAEAGDMEGAVSALAELITTGETVTALLRDAMVAVRSSGGINRSAPNG